MAMAMAMAMAMDSKKQKHTASYIPHDIVESILSRLPVKSLLRLKGVCKQWSATISDDPKFAETHLQRSNASSSSYLQFMGCHFKRIHLENNEFRELPYEKYPVLRSYRHLLGSCDGLHLFSMLGTKVDYLVWNPSSRTHIEVHCPHEINVNPRSNSGICYDPSMKDYKLVMIGDDCKHYAVYYCRSKSWSELKEMNVKYAHSDKGKGVYFKGSIYWISRRLEGCPWFEVVCFDARNEKFRKLENNIYSGSAFDEAYLISSRDCLYFIPYASGSGNLFEKIVIMKKNVDDSWTELLLKLPFPCKWVQPLCSMSSRQNQIMIWANSAKYFLYGDTKIDKATLIQSTGRHTYFDIFPDQENLLLH